MPSYQSPVLPTDSTANLSIAQFMTQYNPDEVPADKIVHVDTISKQPITYGSLRQDAARAAWGLRNWGLQPGNVLMALVTNSLMRRGGRAPFLPTQKDISHLLQIVKPTHIATIVPKLDDVQAALASNSMTETKVLTVLSKVENLPQFPNDIVGTKAEETLPPFDLQGRSSKDVPSAICFSSGTTGKMKGVQLSHYNIIMNAIMLRISMPARVNYTVREVFFAPYCHIYGLSVSVVVGMWVGALYCGLPAFDLETFCKKSSELKVTDLHIVPPVALALAASPVAQKYDLSALKRIVISAAPLKKSVQLLLKKRLPHTSICQGYGLSEATGGVIHQIEEEESAFGCVGKVLPGMEVRLVDPKTGSDVTSGKEGELWIRGPTVMMCYVADKAATEQTFSDGWLKTGDILRVDEHQNFWVTDRLKEMIKYKGFQVAPSELEDILLRHPDVIDAAVCAVYNDAQATEVPLAYVSLTPDRAGLTDSEKQKVLDAIRVWIDDQLAGYKRLRGGVFHLQSLPKTPTGKILRRLLPVKLKEEREAKI
uniref:4-coumarate--CoA ligase-like 9 n=1 Tax=Talaromyces marneffei PM1 TaxID=1077442 RepID=A0A093VQE6_TALMA